MKSVDEKDVIGGDAAMLNASQKQSSEQPAASRARAVFDQWLNKPMRIVLTDKRVVVGIFLCTDQQSNVILGTSREYLNTEAEAAGEEPRNLGLAMVPGRHIVSVHVDLMRPK
jgi:small nuclear ribonucleoprotein (snRNP)-like protein